MPAPSSRPGAPWGQRPLQVCASRSYARRSPLRGVALVAGLVRELGGTDVRLNSPAGPLETMEGGYGVPALGALIEADGVILATPAPDAASLLSSVAPETTPQIGAIEYGASAVVLMRF